MKMHPHLDGYASIPSPRYITGNLAGLTDLLFSYDIRYLIDEMEEMGQNNMAALTSFMQTGQNTEEYVFIALIHV